MIRQFPIVPPSEAVGEDPASGIEAVVSAFDAAFPNVTVPDGMLDPESVPAVMGVELDVWLSGTGDCTGNVICGAGAVEDGVSGVLVADTPEDEGVLEAVTGTVELEMPEEAEGLTDCVLEACVCVEITIGNEGAVEDAEEFDMLVAKVDVALSHEPDVLFQSPLVMRTQ